MTANCVTIDPGVNSVAWARFSKEQLVACGFITGTFPENIHIFRDLPEWQIVTPSLVIEKPKVYDTAKQKGDQGDLINLAMTVGALVSDWALRGGLWATIEPYEWKGQVPKAIMLERIEGYLDDKEKLCIPKLAKAKRHNVIDAIGIGLWATGRMRK